MARTTLAVVIALSTATGLGVQKDDPPRVVKGWAVIMQGMSAIEHYLASGEWSAIHTEETTVNTAVQVLHQESTQGSPAAKHAVTDTLAAFGRQAGELHAAADTLDKKRIVIAAQKLRATYAQLKRLYGEDVLAPAARLAAVHACPMHRDVTGKRGALCGRCGMPLDEPVRIPLLFFGITPTTTVRARLGTRAPLEVGREFRTVLRLSQIEGGPVLTTDLRVVHTERIHLLIVDGSLTDYHHVHPQPTAVPGEYDFTFTPARPGPYRAWADLRTTYTGFQEYAMVDIPSVTKPAPLADRRVKLDAVVDGLTFALRLETSALAVSTPARATLRVSDASGKPFTRLEPIMEAFAHLVAFNEDGKTVLHMHPKTTRRPAPTDRGGPELEFQVYATQPGFYRLFAQVQVKKGSKMAPLGIVVAPPRQATTSATR